MSYTSRRILRSSGAVQERTVLAAMRSGSA